MHAAKTNKTNKKKKKMTESVAGGGTVNWIEVWKSEVSHKQRN